MPNLVGVDLPRAETRIQELTDGAILFTRSHDATGRGRHQIRDADWRVCFQNISPGALVFADTKIDFGTVKLSEPCPWAD